MSSLMMADVYTGDTQPHGRGKMTYANGNFYDGGWKDGTHDGNGRMSYSNGSVYEGKYKHNARNGNGRMSFSNGNVYDGGWKDGQPHGKGKTFYANGLVLFQTIKKNLGSTSFVIWSFFAKILEASIQLFRKVINRLNMQVEYGSLSSGPARHAAHPSYFYAQCDFPPFNETPLLL